MDDRQSYKMSAVVNRATWERFRLAVMWRYGSNYDMMGSEVTRALSDRTNVLMSEAQTANPMVIPEAPVDENGSWTENVFDGKPRGDEKSSEDEGQ